MLEILMLETCCCENENFTGVEWTFYSSLASLNAFGGG